MDNKELSVYITDTILWRDPYIGFDREEMIDQTVSDLEDIQKCREIIMELCNIIREDNNYDN